MLRLGELWVATGLRDLQGKRPGMAAEHGGGSTPSSAYSSYPFHTISLS